MYSPGRHCMDQHDLIQSPQAMLIIACVCVQGSGQVWTYFINTHTRTQTIQWCHNQLCWASRYSYWGGGAVVARTIADKIIVVQWISSSGYVSTDNGYRSVQLQSIKSTKFRVSFHKMYDPRMNLVEPLNKLVDIAIIKSNEQLTQSNETKQQ